jgi:putative hemolysin
MKMSNIFEIILTLAAEILLLLCGAFFASTETAYTSLSRITVRQMVKDNKRNAKKVLRLRNNLESLIATVLIGTNLVTTLISALATNLSLKILGSEYVSYGTALVSILVIIFSETIPKTYAAIRSEKTAIRSANIIIIIQTVFFPIVWIFQQLTKFLNFIEKKFFKTKKSLLTEDELKTLIEVGQKEGTLEINERKMLERLIQFSDLSVHEIMRHRSLVKFVNVEDSVDQVIKCFADTGYSRLPVYQDSPENVIGVLHYKSVLFASKPIAESKDFVRICMRPVEYVPETFTAVELLSFFKKEKCNFALVLNEYGGNEGIVTMDDLLRAVLGRVTDENGNVELPPENRIQVVNTNEFIVPGDMKLDDFNSLLHLDLYSENFDTLGGWLLEQFDELPVVGAVYKKTGTLFIVEDQSARRIQSVRVKFL